MKFVADECVEKQIVDTLRDDGYEIIYILEIEQGTSDERVIAIYT